LNPAKKAVGFGTVLARPVCMIPHWAKSIGAMTLTFAALGPVALVVAQVVGYRIHAAPLDRELRLTEDAGLPVAPDELNDPDTHGVNGAPEYDDAMRMLVKVDPALLQRGLTGIDNVVAGKDGKSDRRDADAVLDASAPAMEKAVLGSVADRCEFPRNWTHQDPTPELRPMVKLAKLLAGRAVLESDLSDLLAAALITTHLGSAPSLAAEHSQDEAIETVCGAAWQIGKRRPDQAQALQGIIDSLPDADLADRVGGELVWGRLHSRSDADQIVMLRKSRALYEDLVRAKGWDSIDKVLEGVSDPRWRQTEIASRKAQERRDTTAQALKMLGMPSGFQDETRRIEV